MTLSRRALLLVAAALLFPFFLSSCNRDSGKIKIAVVTNNPEDFWTIAEKGAQDAANKHGVELIFRKPDKGEAGLQLNILNELVTQGRQGDRGQRHQPEGADPGPEAASRARPT